MARGRKYAKSKSNDTEFQIPTDLNGWWKLMSNNPGDTFAIISFLFVGLYALGFSFAESIVTVSHNVSNPEKLKQHEWVEYVAGPADLFFSCFGLLIGLALHEAFTDFFWGALSKHVKCKYSWRTIASDLLISLAATFMLMEGFSQTWRPKKSGYEFLTTESPQKTALSIKLGVLIHIIGLATDVAMVFGNKMLAKAKSINTALLIHFSLQLGGLVLPYILGYTKYAGYMAIVTTMVKTIPAIATLLAPICIKEQNAEKAKWFKSENIGLSEIAKSIVLVSKPIQLLGCLGGIAFAAYLTFIIGETNLGTQLCFVGAVLSCIGSIIPAFLPPFREDLKAH